MKGKSKGFWLKLIGGTLRKRLEKHENATCGYEGEYVHMKGKSKGFWLKLIGVPYGKGWKSTKNATCVYEEEYVHMKGKSKGFWLKLIGGTLRKRLENHEKRLVLVMTWFFQIWDWNRNSNLSLAFRIGKFHDGGLLNIDFGCFFHISKRIYLSKFEKI